MTVELAPEIEELLNRKVASGEFESREAALSYAVRLLDREGDKSGRIQAEGRAAMQRIRERRKGVKLGADLTIRELIDEGRRH